MKKAISPKLGNIKKSQQKTSPKGEDFCLVQGAGFEPAKPKAADLQSAVFDRSTTPANVYYPNYKFGAASRIRTVDLLFTKQPL